jgi:hypothetical protein
MHALLQTGVHADSFLFCFAFEVSVMGIHVANEALPSPDGADGSNMTFAFLFLDDISKHCTGLPLRALEQAD